MSEKIKAYTRGPQILQILHENGPLHIRALRHIVEPQMRLRRMQEAVERLRKKRLVVKDKHDFYFTSYAKLVLEKMKTALGQAAETFNKPNFRTMEVDQNIQCALWAKRFRDIFPTAHVVRHFHMEKDPIANSVLPRSKDGFEITPNLLVALPDVSHPYPLVIAVEVDADRYNPPYTIKRLTQLATKTDVDGIIHIPHELYIDSTYRNLHSFNNPRLGAYRDKLFGNSFLMFTIDSPYAKERNLKIVGYDGPATFFTNWIVELAKKRSGNIPERVNSDVRTAELVK